MKVILTKPDGASVEGAVRWTRCEVELYDGRIATLTMNPDGTRDVEGDRYAAKGLRITPAECEVPKP